MVDSHGCSLERRPLIPSSDACNKPRYFFVPSRAKMEQLKRNNSIGNSGLLLAYNSSSSSSSSSFKKRHRADSALPMALLLLLLLLLLIPLHEQHHLIAFSPLAFWTCRSSTGGKMLNKFSVGKGLPTVVRWRRIFPTVNVEPLRKYHKC